MKRYIVRKFVMAKNAKQAMRLEKAQEVDDVFLDENWMEANELPDVGFKK